MELHQLRTLILVADECNLGRAAETLGVKLSDIETDLKNLENELGFELFDSSLPEVGLTPEGQSIIGKAHRVLSEAEALMSEARALRGHVTGVFELGVSCDPKLLPIEEFFEAMVSLYPSLNFRPLQRGSGDIQRGLKTGIFDGGFVFGENLFPDKLNQVLLEEQNLVVVGSKHWHEELQRADWPEIAAFPWIWESQDSPQRRLVDDAFSAQGVLPTAVAYSGKGTPTNLLVMAGAGLGLMLEEEALQAEAVGEASVWNKVTFSLELSFVYSKKSGNDPFVLAVLAGLKKAWNLE